MNDNSLSEQELIRKKSFRTLILLILLFGLPYAAAFYFYFSDDASQLLNSSNNGQLVSPVRPMEIMSFKDVKSGEEIQQDFSEGWTMLTLSASDCDTACTNNLYAMKQIRRALGVERNIVNRIMLLTDQDHIDQLITRLDDFYGMKVLTTPNENLTRLKQFLKLGDQSLTNAIFLFDPQGNYMMYYGSSTHPKLVLEDMQLLIKVSNH